jgi:uncharacterized protein
VEEFDPTSLGAFGEGAEVVPTAGRLNIVMAGATGFIGSCLCKELTRAKHHVTALMRGEAGNIKLSAGCRSLKWNRRQPGEWQEVVGRADVVINLAGAPIAAEKWTAEYKQTLRESRIETTKALIGAMFAHPRPGKLLINASAVGYYGTHTGEQTVTEKSPPGRDYLAKLCQDWEAEAMTAAEAGIRTVILRSGIVLGEGGTLERMLPPFKAFTGGPLGDGRQWVPWIHIDDEVGLIQFAIDNPLMQGPVNAVAPNPVRMQEFAETLGRVLGRPAKVRVPPFMLKMMFGEFAEVLCSGQKAVPEAAQRCGYLFKFTRLEEALRDVLRD